MTVSSWIARIRLCNRHINYERTTLLLVGLLGNILIAVFVPSLMLLCMVAGIAGMVAAPVAGWFAAPAFVLLYMLDAARATARLPHAFTKNISLSVPAMIVMYIVAIAFTAALHFKRYPKTGIITDTD